MIRYLFHPVYVLEGVTWETKSRPGNHATRPAERSDLETAPIGVLKDGRTIPLSPHERGELMRRYPVDNVNSKA